MKAWLYCIILLLPLGASAQLVYFGLGYTGNWTKLEGVNQVVQDYNESRPWLDQEMEEFGYLDGFVLNFGGGAGGLWLDMDMGWRSKSRTAHGPDLLGNYGYRDIKVKNSTFGFSFGGGVADEHALMVLGLRFELGQMKMLSRTYLEGEQEPEWVEVHDDLSARVGPTIRFMLAPGEVVAFNLTMYYVWSIFPLNMTDASDAINFTTYGSTDQPQFDSKNHVFGLMLTMNLFGG